MDANFPKLTPDNVSHLTVAGAQVPKANDSWFGAIFRRMIDSDKVAETEQEQTPLRGIKHVAQVHRAFR